MKKKLNVLSVFDGMSCGQIALERAGIEVDKYYASELDNHAIKVTQHNYPETIQLGDVTKWREWEIDWASIDLLQGGSPCQGFSFAGKQLAFDDPRSALFFVYVDILNHIRSLNSEVKFLLENVKMKREYLDVISERLGVQPVFINSALVSAQNRQRYYWANWPVSQPKEQPVIFSDILETNPPGYTVLTDAAVAGFERRKVNYLARGAGHGHTVAGLSGKIPTLLSRYYKDGRECLVACDSGLRKLSCEEVERAFTVPVGYTEVVSNTQRYKMLGNGWTVDVIAHIFRSMK